MVSFRMFVTMFWIYPSVHSSEGRAIFETLEKKYNFETCIVDWCESIIF